MVQIIESNAYILQGRGEEISMDNTDQSNNIESNNIDVEPTPDPTYQLHVNCSNCGFDSGDEPFDIAFGTLVSWSDCPICGCKTLRRIIDE